jgi:cardiolipin synthase A/B
VFSIDIVFATDWFLETDEVLREDVQPYPYEVEPGDVLCQVVPSGPGFPDENNLRLFNSLIYSAQRRLSITSPYFVPDDSLLYAITTAAQRGIDVELFVGEQGDQFMVAMREVEDQYRSLSHQLTLAEWRRRPLRKRYIDNVMQ